MIGVLAGTALGVVRLSGMQSPFKGWMKWHHILGLTCALFVLTWIFSGWLSMDHGRLFSLGKINSDDLTRIEGPALAVPDMPGLDGIARPIREIEWFRLAGQVMMRVIDHAGARETRSGVQRSPWLTGAQVAIVTRALGAACSYAPIQENDAYPTRASDANAPVYRVICDDTWYHIDGADGRVIEKLDASRRAYRWAYQALHTLDFPGLAERKPSRTVIILLLCSGGLAFSLTGVVIGWRRLRHTLR